MHYSGLYSGWRDSAATTMLLKIAWKILRTVGAAKILHTEKKILDTFIMIYMFEEFVK